MGSGPLCPRPPSPPFSSLSLPSAPLPAYLAWLDGIAAPDYTLWLTLRRARRPSCTIPHHASGFAGFTLVGQDKPCLPHSRSRTDSLHLIIWVHPFRAAWLPDSSRCPHPSGSTANVLAGDKLHSTTLVCTASSGGPAHSVPSPRRWWVGNEAALQVRSGQVRSGQVGSSEVPVLADDKLHSTSSSPRAQHIGPHRTSVSS